MTDKGFDQLILEVSTQLINCHEDDFAQHIDAALSALGHFGDKDRCYVFLFNDDLTTMDNVYEWVREGISQHKDDLQGVPEDMMPWVFGQMKNHNFLSVSNVADLPEEAASEHLEFDREGIQSVLCVGMRIGGKLIGFVGCDLVDRQRDWNDSDLRELKIIGDLIANTIARQKAEAELVKMQAQLEKANKQLQRQAREDGLTGVGNRRALDEHLQVEISRCKRHQRPLTVILIDVDHFKPFNDDMGHVLGDKVLQQVAKQISRSFQRAEEFVARYGGDEFVVVCAELPSAEAVARAQRLHANIQAIHIAGMDRDLTVSIGIAHIHANRLDSVTSVIEAVDKATYQAKSNGRDQSFAVTLD